MEISDRDFERIKISVSLSNFIYDYTNLHLEDNSKRKFCTNALEANNGLKTLLKDMYDNEDNRFIDKYKECFSSTFGFHRRKILPDKYINTFNILYMFLEAYRYHKDDFDNFNFIIDDIVLNTYSKDFLFNSNRLDLINKIISNKNYKDVSELRDLFKYVLTCSDDEVNDSYLYYQSMFILLDRDMDGKLTSSIIKYSMDNFDKEERSVVVDLFNSDILSTYDRFWYVNNKLKEVEDNVLIRKEIFSKIKTFNIYMFDELSKDEDYFIKAINIILDSDSYTELTSKLDIVKVSSDLYTSGKYSEGLNMLRLLDSYYHKEIVNGRVISCSLEKPKTIVSRMASLYSSIDSSKSKEFILDVHKNATSISSIHVGIGNISSDDVLECECEKPKVKSFLERLIFRRDN